MRRSHTSAFLLALLCSIFTASQGCDELFEGFGIHLGSMNHFANSLPNVVEKVFDKTYNELEIRHYRTSYESTFSPSRDVYEIKCESRPSSICSWMDIHHEIAKFPDISIIASIWSPPHYMKNEELHTLLVEEEGNYLHYIRNITKLMKDQFNLTVERVSPINEPENLFAPWEHTNMTPQQLCRMVHDFNDSLVSVCPENSYFWISEAYSNTTENANVTCLEACQVFGTHAYALHLGDDEDNLSAYYDQAKYVRKVPGMPIWQTEVSSTFPRSSERQMEEALDMSVNIANFVGHTCIQRYYLWLAYTHGSSGESLIWGSSDGSLTFPKKYYAYKHFTQAAAGGTKRVTKCGPDNLPQVSCLKFGDDNAVFVNTLAFTVPHWNSTAVSCGTGTFCCTNENNDWDCSETGAELIPESICSCRVV